MHQLMRKSTSTPGSESPGPSAATIGGIGNGTYSSLGNNSTPAAIGRTSSINSGSYAFPTSTSAVNVSLNWSSSKPTNPGASFGRPHTNGNDNSSGGSFDNSFKFSREFLLSLYDMDWSIPKDYVENPHATLSSPQPPLANLPLTELEKKLFASGQVNPAASEPLRRANTTDSRYVRDHRSASDREGRSRNPNGK
ncbi:hypothetical protein HK096_006630, partial [Nowakowskiella sp. JEL0078]